MGKEGGMIVMLALGVGAIYLGATGNLDSFWRGLKGTCGAATETETETPPTNAGGQADWTRSNTAFLQGGQRAPKSGQYYTGPNGFLFVSDGGQY